MGSTLTVDNIQGATAAAKVVIPGHVLQFVHNEDYTQTAITQNQTTGFVNVTGFSKAITPISTSSKIYLRIVFHAGNITAGLGIDARIQRNGSTLKHITNLNHRGGVTLSGGNQETHVIEYIDSPSSTSALTYNVQIAHRTTNTGTFTINDPAGGTVGASPGGTILTLMEIGG